MNMDILQMLLNYDIVIDIQQTVINSCQKEKKRSLPKHVGDIQRQTLSMSLMFTGCSSWYRHRGVLSVSVIHGSSLR